MGVPRVPRQLGSAARRQGSLWPWASITHDSQLAPRRCQRERARLSREQRAELPGRDGGRNPAPARTRSPPCQQPPERLLCLHGHSRQGSTATASSTQHQPRGHARSQSAPADTGTGAEFPATSGPPWAPERRELPWHPCSLAPGPASRLTRPELTEEDYPLPGSRRDCVYSRTWADLLVGAHH